METNYKITFEKFFKNNPNIALTLNKRSEGYEQAVTDLALGTVIPETFIRINIDQIRRMTWQFLS